MPKCPKILNVHSISFEKFSMGGECILDFSVVSGLVESQRVDWGKDQSLTIVNQSDKTLF